MNNSKMLSRYFIILLLLLLRLPASASSPEEWKEQLIEQGRKQLKEAQAQNLLNEKAGKGYLNNYLIIVSQDDPSNSQFIQQHAGTGRGQHSFMLTAAKQNNYNEELKVLNAASAIQTYLLLIDYIPLELSSLTDVETATIGQVLTQKQHNREGEAALIAEKAKTEASEIVNRITSSILETTKTATLYCGLVQFRYYVNDQRAKGLLTYFPKSSQIHYEQEYRQLLNTYIVSSRWEHNNENNVQHLIEAIRNNNADFGRLENILAKIKSISNADALFQLLTTMSDNSYSALNITDRLHCLKVLSSVRLDEPREKQVLALLESTPHSDIKQLLEGLRAGNSFAENVSLIKCIIGRTHDEIALWGDNNSLKLNQTIIDLVKNSTDLDARLAKLDAKEENLAMQFGGNGLPLIKVSSATVADNGEVTIGSHEMRWDLFANSLRYSTRDPLPLDNNLYYPISSITVQDPFDLVLFTNHSNLDLVKEASSHSTLQRNEAVLVPAVLLKYAVDKKLNDDLFTAGMVALDAVTIASSGGAALATKVHWLRRAWLLAEVAGAAGNIAINTSSLANNAEFKTSVDTYNVLMVLIGGRSINSFINSTKSSTSLATARAQAKQFIEEVNKAEDGLQAIKAENQAAAQILETRDKILNSKLLTADEAAALRISRNTEEWISVIGKRIDEVEEPPVGYSFYTRADGRKWIRRLDALDPNTPRLTVENGKIVRFLGTADQNQLTEYVYHVKSNQYTQNVIDDIEPAFFGANNRFGPGFYVASQGETAIAEVMHHGGDAGASKVIRFSMLKSNLKILDLTDAASARAWKLQEARDFEIANLGAGKDVYYKMFQELAQNAKAEGYNAIRFYSYRNPGGVNYVILETVNKELYKQVLKPQMVMPALE
jgi:hypothetical protein